MHNRVDDSFDICNNLLGSAPIYQAVILAQARTSGRMKRSADITLQTLGAPDTPLPTFSSRGPRLREDCSFVLR